MIIELPLSDGLTNLEDIAITPLPEKIGSSDVINYSTTIQDIKGIVLTNEEKTLNYLSNDLFEIQEDPEISELTRIKYKDTNDQNVKLMQDKLSDLGAFDESIQSLEFHNKRSYIISTFRVLFATTRILNDLKSNIPEEDLIKNFKELVKNQTTSEDEKHFREKDYKAGVFQYLFDDANIKKNKGYINPEGKVTEQEMGTVILPSVIRVLRGLEDISKRVDPFTNNPS